MTALREVRLRAIEDRRQKWGSVWLSNLSGVTELVGVVELGFESRAWSLSRLPPNLLSRLVWALVREDVSVLGTADPDIQAYFQTTLICLIIIGRVVISESLSMAC